MRSGQATKGALPLPQSKEPHIQAHADLPSLTLHNPSVQTHAKISGAGLLVLRLGLGKVSLALSVRVLFCIAGHVTHACNLGTQELQQEE